MASFRRAEFEVRDIVQHAAVHVGFNMIIAYLNYFLFLPRFLVHKRVFQYVVEFVIPFAIVVMMRIYVQRWVVDGYAHKVKFFYSDNFIMQTIATSLFVVMFVSMLRFAKDWIDFESKKRAIENERLTAELNFLKAQINPHFLFNTLNNLYYLAYSKSPNTTEVIAKLSQMMRYMIYESNYAHVPMVKEIEYMRNYISLERLRLNDQVPIQFDVEGEIEHVRITPLILITFLENAFKHGVSNNHDGAWVKVFLKVTTAGCTYQVENSKLPRVDDQNVKSGIGLANVDRRLALSYPNKHSLVVEDLENAYKITLKLQFD
jgi:two-component system sensor histidine kinase AlgZ